MPDYPQGESPFPAPLPTPTFSLCRSLTGPIHMSLRTSQGRSLLLLRLPWLPILLVSGFLVFVWVPLHLPAVKSSAAPSFLLSFLLAAGKPDLQVCYHCLQSKSKQALSKGPGDSQELSTKA